MRPKYVCLFTAADTFCPAVIFPDGELLACSARNWEFIPVRVRLVNVEYSRLAWALCKGVLISHPFPVAAGGICSIPRVHVFLLNGTVTFQPLCEFALHLLQSRVVGVTWVSRKRPNVALPLFTLFSVANCVGERTVIMWGFCSSLNPTQSCVAEHFSLSRENPLIPLFQMTCWIMLMTNLNAKWLDFVVNFYKKKKQKNATKEVAKARNRFNCHCKQKPRRETGPHLLSFSDLVY